MKQLEQLTKKNQDFVNIATKQLMADGKSDSEIKAILEEALPKILERQAAGETARHFLGAPTAWAASFSQPESTKPSERPTNTNPKLMWLDMSLLLLGILALINATTTLFSKTPTPTKLVSLITLCALGGVALYVNYHYIYRHMGKPRQQRPNLLKSLLILGASMATWVTVSSATALLPDSVNPTLPLPVLVLLAALAFAGRYYLKLKYNVQNAMTPLR